MKKLGVTDPKWSIQKAIQEQIEKESWLEWSKQKTPVLVNNYKPQKFELTETAKYVFSKGVHLARSVMP